MDNIWFCKLLFLFKNQYKDWHSDAAAQVCLCFRAGGNHVVLWILWILCIYLIISFPPHWVLRLGGWKLLVSLPSYTSPVNKNKYCMAFLCPPYWDVCHWFQWVQPGRYPSTRTCKESLRTFPGPPVINPRTQATVVGGGTSTAGPWDGDPAVVSINNEKSGKMCLTFRTT